MRHPLDRILLVGPRSVLFGAHQFLIHPLYVNKAWWAIHKTRPTWRDRIAFFVHDLGYLFQWCPNMDMAEGKLHPEWGARLMSRLFDRGEHDDYWWKFCAGHSRHYAELQGIGYSPLMRPGKLATYLMPTWLYGFLMFLSGEYKEYKEYWIAVGGYPGRPTDNAWTYARHLQEHWGRFRDPNAAVHGENGSI